MKRKFSFQRLLHNNRFLLIVSLIAAVSIWAAVSYGPSNIKERALKVSVGLDLTDTYADTIGLCILDETTYEITVNVEGKWSVISALSSNDINVRVDYSELKKSGEQPVRITATYNSEVTDFDIVSVYPSTINVNCDYWETGLTYKVTPDVSAVTVSDTEKYQLGDAVIDPTVLPDGTVELEGPRSVTSRIKTMVARVTEPQKLSDVAVLSSQLIALDEEGKEVDISSCVMVRPTTTAVNLTVPVWVSRNVTFTYDVKNMPSAFASAEEAVTVSPSSVVLVGPEGDIDEIVRSISHLGTFDFDNLLPDNAEMTIPLNIPSSCTALDNVTEVKVKFNIDSMTTKEYQLTVSSDSGNVVFENLPAAMTATIPQQTLSDILLVGKSSVLRTIDASDLLVTVDMSNSTVGSNRYEARVVVKDKSNVWTYYGEDAHAFNLYVDVTSP